MATFLLGTYIFLILVRPMEWWPPVQNMRLVNLTAILTLLAALPRILGQYNVVLRLPETRLGIALLFATALSLVPTWLGGAANAFFDFGKIIVLYVLIVLLAREPRYFRGLLWTILGCIGWLAIHGILQAYTGTGFGGLGPFMRNQGNDLPPLPQIIAFGIFNDPNDLCLVFICALPLLYAAYKAATSIVPRAIALAMIPLVLYAATLTNSRGGFVGLFGMICAYAIVHTRGNRRWAIVISGVLLIAVIAPSRLSSRPGVDLGRVDAWGDGIAAFQLHPLLGIGYGNFEDISERVAHNSYIHTLTELGLVGYIPWFLLIFLTVMHLRRAISLKESLAAPERLYLSGLFSALIGYLTAAYFLSRQYNPVLYILLAMAITQVLIVCKDDESRAQVFGPLRKDLRLGFLFCMASIPFFWLTIRIANALGGRS